MNDYCDILLECSKIGRERQEQYGMAGDSIQTACDILKTAFGLELTRSQFAMVLVSLKLSRNLIGSKKDDNLIDAINYLAIALNESKEYENK